MAHLRLEYSDEIGSERVAVYASLQEFIPLTRQITRSLHIQCPHLTPYLADYRVRIKPQYYKDENRAFTTTEFILNPKGSDHPPEPIADVYRLRQPPALLGETIAFNNPGTSRLCDACPEAWRCPGSGKATTESIEDWITLDLPPDAPHDTMSSFQLTLETPQGILLYRGNFPVTALQATLDALFNQIKEDALLRATQVRVAVIPVAGNVTDERRVSRYREVKAVSGGAVQTGNSDLIDWDDIEGVEDDDYIIDMQESEEFDIVFISEEKTETPEQVKAFPQVAQWKGVRDEDNAMPGEMRIYIARKLYDNLLNIHQSERARGLLSGLVCRTPDTSEQFIQIMTTVETRPSYANDFDLGALRLFDQQVKKQFPERTMLGWLFIQPIMPAGDILLVSGSQVFKTVKIGLTSRNSNRLSQDEYLLHQNFFPEPWHVILKVDVTNATLRFYHWYHQLLVEASGYYITD